MKKTKKYHEKSPEPYEDMIRLESLDPYESLIKSKNFLKKDNKAIQQYELSLN